MTDRYDLPEKTRPCYLIYDWVCPQCGATHTSEFYSAELGDDDMDCFDFYCECGAYFKKFWRVPTENITNSFWKPKERSSK